MNGYRPIKGNGMNSVLRKRIIVGAFRRITIFVGAWDHHAGGGECRLCMFSVEINYWLRISVAAVFVSTSVRALHKSR